MVYLFLDNGFEEIEAITVIDILRRAKIDIEIIALKQKDNIGAHGIKIIADHLIDDIKFEKIDMVILPGGMPGTLNLAKSEKLKNCLNYCNKNNIKMAAICAAPSIFGLNGYLKNKTATCYPGFEDKLIGTKISTKSCVTDGNITTANGPGNATEFALELVKILKNKTAKANIKTEMLI